MDASTEAKLLAAAASDDLPPEPTELRAQSSMLQHRGLLSPEQKLLVQNLIDSKSDIDVITNAFAACDDTIQWALFEEYLAKKIQTEFVSDVNQTALEKPRLLRQLSDLTNEGLLNTHVKDAVKEIVNADKNQNVVEWMRDILSEEKRKVIAENDEELTLESLPDELKGDVANVMERRHEELLENWELQAEELASLVPIFEDEIKISQSRPLSALIYLKLLDVECTMELGVLFPPTYPTKSECVVRAYIPPPFSAKVSTTKLNKLLRLKAEELVGAEAVFELVEEARQFIDDNIDLFRTSGEVMEDTQPHVLMPGSGYSVAGPNKVTKLVNEIIENVQSTTGLDSGSSKMQLRMCLWNSEKLFAQFKTDHDLETKTSKAKVTEKKVPEVQKQSVMDRFEDLDDVQDAYIPKLDLSQRDFECCICFNTQSVRRGACLGACTHYACIPCWNSYLTNKIDMSEPYIGCPGFDCKEYVEETMILPLVSSKLYIKYRRWLYNSFLQLKSFKWCPEPACQYVGLTKGCGNIYCPCGTNWCFSCQESAHWPVSCSELVEYQSNDVISKLRGVVKKEAPTAYKSKNMLTVYTKNCPKCNASYEKNDGCNHMRCAVCGHNFCWMCLGDWNDHNNYFKCSAENKTLANKTVIKTARTFDDTSGKVWFRKQVLGEMKYADLAKNMGNRMVIRRAKLKNHSKLTGKDIDKYRLFIREAHTLIKDSYIVFVLHYKVFEQDAVDYPLAQEAYRAFNTMRESADTLGQTLENACTNVNSGREHHIGASVNNLVAGLKFVQKNATQYADLMRTALAEYVDGKNSFQIVNLVGEAKASSKHFKSSQRETTEQKLTQGRKTNISHLKGFERW